jgi:hypothetical protein
MDARIVLIALAYGGAANATQYCVTSSVSLAATLQTVGTTAEDDGIRVARGDYAIATNLLVSPVFTPNGPLPTGALTLSGGWDANCTTQLLGAQRTVLRSIVAGLRVELNPTGDLSVGDLTFESFDGGVLLTPEFVPAGDDVLLRASRVAVFADVTQTYGLRLRGDAVEVAVDNVLVDVTAACALAVGTTDPSGSVSVWSSTLVARPLDDGSIGAAACFDSEPVTAENASVNSIFSSPATDVFVDGAPVLMQWSVFGQAAACSQCGAAIANQSMGNFQRETVFSAGGTTTASRFAQIRDGTVAAGDLADTGLISDITFPADVEGTPRPLAAAPSRGAFQLAAALFSDGFEDP